MTSLSELDDFTGHSGFKVLVKKKDGNIWMWDSCTTKYLLKDFKCLTLSLTFSILIILLLQQTQATTYVI